MAARTHQLLVNLGASQTRRRLKGHGFGVKKVETAGKGQAVITHTATGEHLAGLRSLFADVLVNESEANAWDQVEGDLL